MKKNNKGFSLIELIIVIAIIAILVAAAFPALNAIRDRAQENVDLANASVIVTNLNAFNALFPDDAIAAVPADRTAYDAVVGAQFALELDDYAFAIVYVEYNAGTELFTVNAEADSIR